MIKKLNLEKIQTEQGVRSGDPSKCCVPGCNHAMEFDSPDYLCHHHWCQWWVDGMELNKEAAYEKEYKFIFNVRYDKIGR